MRNCVVRAVLVTSVLLSGCATVSITKPLLMPQPTESVFAEEPAARALYDKMIESMRNAETMYYESEFRWEADRREISRCTYRMWMRKPNYARLELMREDEPLGVLVGDGDYFWIYWPNGRPRWPWERSGERAKEYERTRFISYMKKSTPIAQHSIAHAASDIGGVMFTPIFDPSTFHGYTDSLQRYLDGVRSMGTEAVSGEECDVIEVSIMKGQRTWYLWLSKRDQLPRKMKEEVGLSHDNVTYERWCDVSVNGDIPIDKFAWTPPSSWEEFRFPAIEEGLLKPGTEAPDFDLVSVDGGRIRLSDYRGKVLWFYLWRAG